MAKSEVRSKRARKPRFRFRKGRVLAVTQSGAGFSFIRVGGRYFAPDGRWYCFHDNTALAYAEDDLRPLTKAEKGEGGRRGK